jgi:hypothetical protein
VLASVREKLLSMRARDELVRNELAANGSLFDGYHPRMQEIHRFNAQELRRVIQEHGWPHEDLAGPDGAEAAWLVAQHSIGEPNFMRRCRTLLDEASSHGRVPRWQFAYIDDRIRVFEGKPQCFGTQIKLLPEGPEVHELENSLQVDAWRWEIGLSAIAVALAKVQGDPLPSMEEHAAKQAAGLLWRRKVGWIE